MERSVDEYIEKQESPQKEILQKIRKIFLETLPMCQEKITWGVVTFAADKFYIAALKDCVHVGFAINGLSKDEIGLFEGTGKTMRHIKIHSVKDINEKKLVQLIKLVDKKAKCKPC
jgi:hypothetical protein